MRFKVLFPNGTKLSTGLYEQPNNPKSVVTHTYRHRDRHMFYAKIGGEYHSVVHLRDGGNEYYVFASRWRE